MTALEKLEKSLETNIVFLGESITEAEYGTEAYKDSWAYRVECRFRERYGGKLNFFNCGVSGTGSGLGIFRLSRDVLPKNPDIVFIEYAINDLDEIDRDKGKILIDMEGIVRKLKTANPDIAVVFLYSGSRQYRNCSFLHQIIAEYYGIPAVDLQEYVKSFLSDGKHSWEEFYADNVHPNAKGHGLYARCILDSLEKESVKFLGTAIKEKEPLMNYRFDNPRMTGWQQGRFTGNWKVCELNQPGKIESIIYSDTVGDSFEFDFGGRCLGLYYQVSTDGGRLECRIDGEREYKIEMYDSYEWVSLSRFQVIDLGEGPHHAVFTVSRDKHPESTGNTIRVGYFLLDGVR